MKRKRGVALVLGIAASFVVMAVGSTTASASNACPGPYSPVSVEAFPDAAAFDLNGNGTVCRADGKKEPLYVDERGTKGPVKVP